jgi:hypothetical protein
MSKNKYKLIKKTGYNDQPNKSNKSEQSGGANIKNLSSIIGAIYSGLAPSNYQIEMIECDLVNNDKVVNIIKIKYKDLGGGGGLPIPVGTNHYSIQLTDRTAGAGVPGPNVIYNLTHAGDPNDKTHAKFVRVVGAGGGPGPDFVTRDFLYVKFDNLQIEYTPAAGGAPPIAAVAGIADPTNCSEELIHYIIHRLVSHRLANSALAIYARNKFNITSGLNDGITENDTLKSGFNDGGYHEIKFDPARDYNTDPVMNVYGQTYSYYDKLVCAVSSIKPYDSMISLKYCSNKSYSCLANLIKALAISRPDRTLSDNEQIFTIVFRKENGDGNYNYTLCMANSNLTLENKANFVTKQIQKDTACDKTIKTIGTFIIDKEKKIYANYSEFTHIMPYQTLLCYKGGPVLGFTYYYVRNTYNRDDKTQIESLKVDFDAAANIKYRITDAHVPPHTIYDENQARGQELINLHLYVCTFNLSPLESKIRLIELLFMQ